MRFLWCDFALMQLENLHHYSNLCDNVWFNAIWKRPYEKIFSIMRFGIHKMWLHLILCWRLAQNDVTVTPSFTHTDWLHW